VEELCLQTSRHFFGLWFGWYCKVKIITVNSVPKWKSKVSIAEWKSVSLHNLHKIVIEL
jgi:hypothetical protein